MLNRDYFGSKLSKDYESLLSPEGKDALTDLKRYFGRENLIKNIRNKYAFHYGREVSGEIIEQINTIKDDEEFAIYLSNWIGNCFFYFSEVIITSAMLGGIKPDDAWESLKRLFDEVLGIAKTYLRFLNACIFVITEKYGINEYEEIEIPDPPTSDDVKLPCFLRKK